MAITLQDIKLNSQDTVLKGVVEEFQKSSALINAIPFVNTVVAGGGNSLTYSYLRTIQEAGAAFRAYGSDYTESEAKKEQKSVDLAVLGNKFSLDRIYAGSDSIVDELTFQLQQSTKSVATLFQDKFIAGDVSVDTNGFDGLSKALAGASTEFGASTYIDVSTGANAKTNAEQLMEALDTAIASLNGAPSMILGNLKGKLKLQAVARQFGYLSQNEDAFGRPVVAYQGVPIVDMGATVGSENPIIPIVDTRKPDSTNVITGLCDLYVVRFDSHDGVAAASLASGNLISTYVPNFNADGEAVKTGAVEMVAAPVIYSTKAAAVIRNIKVQ